MTITILNYSSFQTIESILKSKQGGESTVDYKKFPNYWVYFKVVNFCSPFNSFNEFPNYWVYFKVLYMDTLEENFETVSKLLSLF